MAGVPRNKKSTTQRLSSKKGVVPEEIQESREGEFESEMQALAAAAEDQLSGPRKAHPTLLQMLRPLVIGIEALSRATAEQTAALNKLEELAAKQSSFPELMERFQESHGQTRAVNQQLFDALHNEMCGYKDEFLLDVLHKPVIRDLITLYDDVSAIAQQLKAFLKVSIVESGQPLDFIRQLSVSIVHTVDSIVEILARMDVSLVDQQGGKLDKLRHRVVAMEMTEMPSEDGDILRSVRPGFLWRERLIRPEEVVIKKLKDSNLTAVSAPKPS